MNKDSGKVGSDKVLNNQTPVESVSQGDENRRKSCCTCGKVCQVVYWFFVVVAPTALLNTSVGVAYALREYHFVAAYVASNLPMFFMIATISGILITLVLTVLTLFLICLNNRISKKQVSKKPSLELEKEEQVEKEEQEIEGENDDSVRYTKPIFQVLYKEVPYKDNDYNLQSDYTEINYTKINDFEYLNQDLNQDKVQEHDNENNQINQIKKNIETTKEKVNETKKIVIKKFKKEVFDRDVTNEDLQKKVKYIESEKLPLNFKNKKNKKKKNPIQKFFSWFKNKKKEKSLKKKKNN